MIITKQLWRNAGPYFGENLTMYRQTPCKNVHSKNCMRKSTIDAHLLKKKTIFSEIYFYPKYKTKKKDKLTINLPMTHIICEYHFVTI